MKKLVATQILFCLFCSAQLWGLEDTESTWNQWRGPARTGEANGPKWPSSLDDLSREWRVELGKGYSGPVVSKRMVFVVETVDQGTEGARAFDRASGRELWRTRWTGTGQVPFFARKNGDWIRSTPAYDGESLFVGGMEEVLHRLDAATGRIVWSIDFPKRFKTPAPDFGFASSPMVDGDYLYVQAANSIIKIDKVTGETIWRGLVSDDGIMNNGAFSSPVLATLVGLDHLLVQSRHTLNGLDPTTGELWWSRDVPSFRGMNILTPTVWKDSVLTSSYKNLTHLFELSADSVSALTIEESWTYKASGYMSSPIVIGNDVYLHLGNGRLTCIDLETGESRWTSKPLGDYWSLAFQGDKILALTESGELQLLRSNPNAIEILGTAKVANQSTWGHIAVDNDRVFVRELEGLAVFGLSPQPVAASGR